MLFPFILHSPQKWNLVIIPGTASGAIRIFLILYIFLLAGNCLHCIPANTRHRKFKTKWTAVFNLAYFRIALYCHCFCPKNTANQVNFSGTAEKRRRSNSAGSNYGPNPLFNPPLTTSKITKPACIGSKHFLKNFLRKKSKFFNAVVAS